MPQEFYGSNSIVHLKKDREKQREAFEELQKKIQEEQQSFDVINRFASNNQVKADTALPSDVVGLVDIEEMRQKHQNLLKPNDHLVTGATETEEKPKPKEEPKKESRIKKNMLSFQFDDEEEEDVVPIKKGRLGMDPNADTSFIPDPEKEAELAREKERLAKEWREMQEKEKNEEIVVDYCYWDGSSHRKNMRVKKGFTISQFLGKALELLRKEFTDLKPANVENLMLVKEDLIIPHFYTFQDFIATKTMGKTGPLGVFNESDMVIWRQESSVDLGETHPAKIVLRTWYEKNKHIYPANRWEGFVPNKVYKKNIDDDPSEDPLAKIAKIVG